MPPTNIRLKPPPPCPDCGGQMRLKRPDPKATWETFWGCANFPDCRGTRGIQYNGLPEGASMWGGGYDE